MTRRESRELIFELIFEWEFSEKASVEDVISLAKEAREIEMNAFALDTVSGVVLHIDEIDKRIFDHSHKWKKGRVSVVALSVLRLAVYEMMFLHDVPVSVSINEAVEIAKKYGGEEDSAYINGVLGGISRSEEYPDEKRDGNV